MGAAKGEKSSCTYFKSGPGIIKFFNVILAVCSFVCVTIVCLSKNSKGHSLCYILKGFLIWKIYLLIDIVLSIVVLILFLLIPRLRNHEKVKLIMMLYNLIQSLSHIYMWMIGTKEVNFMSQGPAKFFYVVYAAIAFTQLNGVCFFFGVFVYGKGFTTVIGDVDWDGKEEEANSEDPSKVAQSAPESMVMSGEQTVDASAAETADNSVDPSAEQMTK